MAQPTHEEQTIVDSVLKFIDREVMPIQHALGETFENPRLYYLEDGRESPLITDARRKAREASARAGFYAMFGPPQFGGLESSMRLWFVLWEAICHRYGPPATQLPYYILSNFTVGPHEIWSHASPALLEELMPKLSSGELQGCFGMSEPDAGSDSWMMRTNAVRDGDDWIINGSKQWTSWSPSADYILVLAVTNKELVAQRKGGITCFYVPTDTPGYKLESVVRMFGHIGGEEAILSFTDVRVPDRFRVGEVDKGLSLAMLGVRHGRMDNAARGLGTARWAMDKAIEYAKIRRTFGKTIAEHQTIQNYLADAATKLYAGRAMALDCAAKIDEGRDVRTEVSMVKLFCTRIGSEVIDACMQIHGGMGLANETRIVDAWQETRRMHITEGTNEIQMRSIAQNIFRGQVDLSFP